MVGERKESAPTALFSNTFSKKSISPFGSPEGIQMTLSVIAQNKEDRFFRGLVFEIQAERTRKRHNSAVVPKELQRGGKRRFHKKFCCQVNLKGKQARR